MLLPLVYRGYKHDWWTGIYQEVSGFLMTTCSFSVLKLERAFLCVRVKTGVMLIGLLMAAALVW